jgi:PAS domain S-box-containing protein
MSSSDPGPVERRRADDATYEAIFRQSPQITWIWDPATVCFLAANDAAVAAYGWSEEELRKRPIFILALPQDQTEMERLFGPPVRGHRCHRVGTAAARPRSCPGRGSPT